MGSNSDDCLLRTPYLSMPSCKCHHSNSGREGPRPLKSFGHPLEGLRELEPIEICLELRGCLDQVYGINYYRLTE